MRALAHAHPESVLLRLLCGAQPHPKGPPHPHARVTHTLCSGSHGPCETASLAPRRGEGHAGVYVALPSGLLKATQPDSKGLIKKSFKAMIASFPRTLHVTASDTCRFRLHLKRKKSTTSVQASGCPSARQAHCAPHQAGSSSGPRPERHPGFSAPREALWRPPAPRPIWEVKNGWGVPSGTRNMQLVLLEPF